MELKQLNVGVSELNQKANCFILLLTIVYLVDGDRTMLLIRCSINSISRVVEFLILIQYTVMTREVMI